MYFVWYINTVSGKLVEKTLDHINTLGKRSWNNKQLYCKYTSVKSYNHYSLITADDDYYLCTMYVSRINNVYTREPIIMTYKNGIILFFTTSRIGWIQLGFLTVIDPQRNQTELIKIIALNIFNENMTKKQ